MSKIAPLKKLTFTITTTPKRMSDRKTIERLMGMQTSIQKGRNRLALRRRQTDNEFRQRGGRMWNVRVKASGLVRADQGESFTLTVTPQMLPDIMSVEKFLEAKTAK